IEQAVVTIGFARLRSIVLAVKVFEFFQHRPSSSGSGFNRGEFWRHVLAVACAARRMAPESIASRQPSVTVRIDPEEAFLAGLLHDIGKVALDFVFPKAYQRITSRADQTRGEIADAERSILGVDHAIAGRRLAERWNLPEVYHDVIWLHHLAPPAL